MQSQSNDEGVGEGLANRVAQSAAVAADREHDAAPPVTGTPAKATPQDMVTNRPKTIKGEKRIPSGELQKMTKKLGSTPVYDKGGQVNVNDGQHQAAILKDGERVLTPEQNKDWEKSNPGARKAPMTLPIGGKTMRDANDVTPEIKPTPKAPLYDKGGSVDCYDKGGEAGYHHNDYSSDEKSQFHRSMAHLHQGGLHRALGIAEGSKIPMAKVEAATHSEDAHTRKMAVMAKSMHSWSHTGKK
jgi:hypothetical protein